MFCPSPSHPCLVPASNPILSGTLPRTLLSPCAPVASPPLATSLAPLAAAGCDVYHCRPSGMGWRFPGPSDVLSAISGEHEEEDEGETR
eukprot:7590944-Pyramimonas_sp.AAC.1